MKGVVAYNVDLALKSGPQVLYTKEKTKGSVEMIINGKSYKGIIAITQQIKDNNNGVPVVIRIIGQVSLNDLSCSDRNRACSLGVKGATQESN